MFCLLPCTDQLSTGQWYNWGHTGSHGSLSESKLAPYSHQNGLFRTDPDPLHGTRIERVSSHFGPTPCTMTTSVTFIILLTGSEPVSSWWEAEHGLILKNVPVRGINRIKHGCKSSMKPSPTRAMAVHLLAWIHRVCERHGS